MIPIKTTINKLHAYGTRNIILGLWKFIVRDVYFQKVLNSYSQHGEDIVIDQLLNKKSKGFYIDVGAYDPIKISNTYRFYLKGWWGINIEPNSTKIAKFKQLRPKDNNVNLGIGSRSGKLILYHFSLDSLNTFSLSESKHYQKCGFKLEKSEKVTVSPLRVILKKYSCPPAIDLLSIDTQGMEMEVLQSNDWTKYKPKVICIETYESPDKKATHYKSVHTYLQTKGYLKSKDIGLNSIFVKYD